MTFAIETATVYRGGKRRYFTKKAAIRAEAVEIIKRKHPSEKSEYDDMQRCTYEGWHWTSIPRQHVLLRRVMRLVEKNFSAKHSVSAV